MKGIDIKSLVFDKGAFGYKVDEVTSCLKEISEYAISLENKVVEYEKKIKSLENKMQGYKDNEESVKEIIISAQKFKDSVINEAQEKADKIAEDIEKKKLEFDSEINNKAKELITDARRKADEMMKDTKNKFENESRNLKMIKKEVSDFKSKLLSLYKSHLDIITKIPEYEENSSVDNIETVDNINVEDGDGDIYESADVENSLDVNNKDEYSSENSEVKTFKNQPVFKVTLKDNDGVEEGDYIKSRFSKLRFGENN